MSKPGRLEARQAQLDELSGYLDSSEDRLSGVLQRLGWTRDSTEYVDTVVCPLDSGHRIPPSSLTEHVRNCRLAKAGYDAEERERMKESSHFYYTNSLSVVPVMIDRDIQERIISQCAASSSSVTDSWADGDQTGNSSQITSFAQAVSSDAASGEERRLPLRDEDLTTAQRLAMHTYVIQQARATNKRPAFSVEDSTLTADLAETVQKQDADGKGPKTHLELLAELRDYKRRRQSYRAKNVHITKRSTTEVMRQVIETQMEMLEQMNRGSKDSDRNSEQMNRGSKDTDRNSSDTDNRSTERSSSPAVPAESPRWQRRPDSPRLHHRHRSSQEDGRHGNGRHGYRDERHAKHKKSRDRSRSRSPSRKRKHRH